MKLLQFDAAGRTGVGLWTSAGIRDLSAHVKSLSGPALDPDCLASLRGLDSRSLPLVSEPNRIAPCVAPGGRVVCAGLNYRDHALEVGMELPGEPVLFMKGCKLTGPFDAIMLPAGSSKVDWELELAVVIGRHVLCADERQAQDCVAGYATFIDVSARDWQMERAGQIMKGKSWPSFAPIGPWLVTPDEIENVQALAMQLSVNHRRMQNSSTGNMIFTARWLVSYVSQFMELNAGDVIATGTPAGVGHGMKPPKYLQSGDEVLCGIEGLGEQIHRCESHSPHSSAPT